MMEHRAEVNRFWFFPFFVPIIPIFQWVFFMETLRYGDFSLSLHQRVVAGRVPANGTIEVTRRCPMRCVHCYNNLPLDDREARLKELSYEEHCRILDEIAEAGCLWLLYTGGEIFARRDFLDIYTYAKKKGMLITLFTNGTLITPKVADYLTDWRPFSIEITLYGCTQETYERITGIPGSFERCMNGIHLLKDRGLPVKLKTVVMTLNRHELRDMKQYAEEELGLEFRFDAMINARIDCSHGPLSVRLKPEQVVGLDLEDPKRMTEWKKFAEQFNGSVHAPDHKDDLYYCGAGINAFSIDPSGMLTICAFSYGEAFDLRQGSFREGWEDFLLKVRRKKVTRLTKCSHCEMKVLCGMCPTLGELEEKDGEEPVDFLCQVAHLRAQAIGLPFNRHGECKYCQD